jgi:hypothetical protein
MNSFKHLINIRVYEITLIVNKLHIEQTIRVNECVN